MSNPDPYWRVKDLFAEALEKPPAERDAFLAAACAGDSRLRQEIDELLTAHDRAVSVMAQPTASPPRRLHDLTLPSEQLGEMIGPYKLLENIGEGGFGTVYLAEQELPVRRRVALKIIKLGMDTRQVVARFEQERQALAMMDHPNIARVLDAGATASGRPFFVMDLVKGESITRYCDRNNLPVIQRLELFTQVCAAVQHAHTKGIIHRDIKPSNVLVSEQDGRLSAKVIDFGVAKATASRLTEKTLFTEHKQLIGTPEYMSPEQAEGSLDIDTRTDVYSLGVLLYELLTGTTPFDARSLRSAAYGEIQRIIREVEPPKPSTRLSESADTLASVAAHRDTEPRRLGTIVRGDLDWIVMKALEKDRLRRYETANGVAQDIRRYLDGEAVLAAPPGRTYRLRKFVRRNKGAVAAAAAIAASLLLASGVSVWFGLRESAARQRESVQRAVAEAAKTDAEQQKAAAVAAESETRKRADELQKVSDFQAQMLAQVDPTEAGRLLSFDVLARFDAALAKAGVPEAERAAQTEAFGGNWRRVNATDVARELIDRTILKPAVETTGREFKDQPAVDASLRQVLATLYRDLGLYDAAMPLQEQALETRRRVLGGEHPDTLTSIGLMGTLLQARGKFNEAEPYFRESLEKRRRVLGEDHRQTVNALYDVGFLLQAQGKLADAEPYQRQSMERSRRVLGSDHRDTLMSVNDLGVLLREMGKMDEAEIFTREALEGRRRTMGEDHTSTMSSIVAMGLLLEAQGKYDQAEPYYRQALEKYRRVLGEDHPGTLVAISNMGALLYSQGKLAEAEPFYRESLDKSRRILGDEHPSTLSSIAWMGTLSQTQGKLDQAEPYLREAVERSRRVLGMEHRDTLNALAWLGALLKAQGKLEEAEACFRETAERFPRALGAEHPDSLGMVANLGSLLTARHKYPEAEAVLLPAAALADAKLSPDHRYRATLIRSVAALYTAWHAAEPDKGYDAKAQQWKAKLPTTAPAK